MKALLFKGKQHALTLAEIAKPKPVKDQVLIRIHYAALNHRDLWLIDEHEQEYPQGIILGSDGAGIIEAVGDDVDETWIGQEVIINPSLDWGNNPIVQGDKFRILGLPDHGTFAEYIVISKQYVFEKPEHLTLAEASAVPLSALTAYRALFSKARLRAGEKVLITGIGGGAALWALQQAVAYNAQVYVTSSSTDKLNRAAALGAKGGYNYREANWAEQAQRDARGFDVIIDSAGGDQFNKLIELAVPGGRIVNFGRTAGNITDMSTRLLYWKQLSIYGTTMGTRDEFLSMLNLLESRKVKPVIDGTFLFSNFEEAFARMKQSEQFGKLILQLV